jgi:hypothetical protein
MHVINVVFVFLKELMFKSYLFKKMCVPVSHINVIFIYVPTWGSYSFRFLGGPAPRIESTTKVHGLFKSYVTKIQEVGLVITIWFYIEVSNISNK